MRKGLFGFVLIGVVMSTSLASAFDWNAWPALGRCWPHCVQTACCDDYCPKPAPCARKVQCFTCDNYCPKCAPCAQKVSCFGCDDYCAKCPPMIHCPVSRAFKGPCASKEAGASKCAPANATVCRSSAATSQQRAAKYSTR